VSLSLHSPESPAYGETTKVLLRYHAIGIKRGRKATDNL
jgi:hypothetical protein